MTLDPQTQETLLAALVFGMAAIGVLGALAAFGLLGAKAMTDRPKRESRIGAIELFVAFFATFAGQIGAGLVMRAMGIGADAESMEELSAMAAGQLVVASGTAGLMAIVLVVAGLRVAGRISLTKFGLLPRSFGWEAITALNAIFCLVPIYLATNATLMLIYRLLEQPPPDVGHALIGKLMASDDIAAWLLLGFGAVVLAPVSEEILYRGFLHTFFVNLFGDTPGGKWKTILVASCLFSVMHAHIVPLIALPSLAVVGAVFGYVYERTGSLWPCIFIHMAFNGGNMFLAFRMSGVDM